MSIPLIVAVDFDGTCVTHEYPKVGLDIGAQEVLKRLVDNNHKIILFTMRSGEELEQAVTWFRKNKIPLFGINKNPEQHTWTSSPKPYAHLYIDDAALGCPLKQINSNQRAYVDWDKVEKFLIKRELI